MQKCYEHMATRPTWVAEQISKHSSRHRLVLEKAPGDWGFFFDLVSRPGGYIKIKKFFEAGGYSN